MPRPEKLFRSPLDGSMASLFDDLAPIDEIDVAKLKRINKLHFMSLGSGSSGNCSYMGDGTTGFLIDAGVRLEQIEEGLMRNGIFMDSVKGIILTHDHSDHVKFAYTIVRQHRHMALYCTPKAFNGIMRRHSISRRLKDYHKPVYKEFPFKIGPFEITPFEVIHDGTDNVGFYITHGDHRVAVATDLGCISDRVAHYMRLARQVIIEANYDAAMLRTGPYPEYLKARIAAGAGHLDNAITGEFLGSLIGRSEGAPTHVFLCHLSHDNNTPQRAIATVSDHIRRHAPGIRIETRDPVGFEPESGRSVCLYAMPRFEPSPLFTFRLD